jgi:N-acylneuraminate cytidylyltransferase
MAKKQPTIVALIPARAGSKRVPDKNIRPLAGHPLMAYTVAAALKSNVFSDVIVSTDSEKYAEMARYYGAEVPFMRPSELAGDVSPDIEWVEYTLKKLQEDDRKYDCFSILRPTSPFRLPETIQRAWQAFLKAEGVDSLRAVEKCHQHPGKMWIVRGNRMMPLLPLSPPEQPWHSSQYQSLPEVYVQNASLEIAWTRVVLQARTIAGTVLMPFLTAGYEGFDVNNPFDWDLAEHLVTNEDVPLPVVSRSAYLAKNGI